MVLHKERKHKVTSECFAEYNGYLYFASREINLLYRINLKTEELEFVTNLPDENMLEDRLYNGMCIEGDKLLLVPFNAARVWIYDFLNKSWDYVELIDYMDISLKGKFAGGELRHNKAYLFGYMFRGILVVDLSTKKVMNLLAEETAADCSFWGQTYALVNEKIYVSNRVKNEILMIHPETNLYEKISLGNNQNRYVGIIWDSGDFWLLPHHGNVIHKWDGNRIFVDIMIPDFYNSAECYFNGICPSGKKLLLYSPKGRTCIFDKENPEKSFISKEKIFFAKYLPDIGVIVCTEGKILICDEELMIKSAISVELSEKLYSEYLTNSRLDGKARNENNIIGLSEFIILIQNSDKKSNKSENDNFSENQHSNSVGEKILKTIFGQ